MSKCKYVDICGRDCNKCGIYKKYNRRRMMKKRLYSACCVVGTLSAILLLGLAGSLECNRITVAEFITMCILPVALVIGSVELADIVKER